eukprot:PhF_6_TR33877/c0_g1_i1/m.49716
MPPKFVSAIRGKPKDIIVVTRENESTFCLFELHSIGTGPSSSGIIRGVLFTPSPDDSQRWLETPTGEGGDDTVVVMDLSMARGTVYNITPHGKPGRRTISLTHEISIVINTRNKQGLDSPPGPPPPPPCVKPNVHRNSLHVQALSQRIHQLEEYLKEEGVYYDYGDGLEQSELRPTKYRAMHTKGNTKSQRRNLKNGHERVLTDVEEHLHILVENHKAE